MITITFADQSLLELNNETLLTFWMHSNLKLAFERGMEQSLAKLTTTKIVDLSQQTLLALLEQSAFFTVENYENTYFSTKTIVKVQF